jgi:hypothetical protein
MTKMHLTAALLIAFAILPLPLSAQDAVTSGPRYVE